MTDALLIVLGLGADAHAFLARVRARHHHAPGRESHTKEAAMTIPSGEASAAASRRESRLPGPAQESRLDILG